MPYYSKYGNERFLKWKVLLQPGGCHLRSRLRRHLFTFLNSSSFHRIVATLLYNATEIGRFLKTFRICVSKKRIGYFKKIYKTLNVASLLYNAFEKVRFLKMFKNWEGGGGVSKKVGGFLPKKLDFVKVVKVSKFAVKSVSIGTIHSKCLELWKKRN